MLTGVRFSLPKSFDMNNLLKSLLYILVFIMFAYLAYIKLAPSFTIPNNFDKNNNFWL